MFRKKGAFRTAGLERAVGELGDGLLTCHPTQAWRGKGHRGVCPQCTPRMPTGDSVWAVQRPHSAGRRAWLRPRAHLHEPPPYRDPSPTAAGDGGGSGEGHNPASHKAQMPTPTHLTQFKGCLCLYHCRATDGSRCAVGFLLPRSRQ